MAPAASQLTLPDEVTEDILLRLDSAADGARAADASTAHRRVVRGHRFQRRFRSLHPSPVIGFLSSLSPAPEFHPAEALHRSAPLAHAAAREGDFSFSFLPSEIHGWFVRDARDGRVLLSRRERDGAFLDLVVCDPLRRRYVLIPRIPDEVVLKRYSAEMGSEPFLAAASEEEGEELKFKVIYNWMSKFKIDTFVFTSDTGKWCAATSASLVPDRVISNPKVFVRHYVRGCFYWVHYGSKHMLVLDQGKMKFLIVATPFLHADKRIRGLAAFDAGVNVLGLIVLGRDDTMLELYYKNNGGGVEEEWRRDKCIPLPEPGYVYSIIRAAEGYLLLFGEKHGEGEGSQYFTIDLKTFMAERLCWMQYAIIHVHLYASYPSLLSAPSI